MASIAVPSDSLNASVKDALPVGESAPPTLRGMSRSRAIILERLCQAAWRRERPQGALADAAERSGEAARLLDGMQFGQPLEAELEGMLRKQAGIGGGARASLVERCILKMALAEMRGFPQTPRGVVVSEAVKLAETFGTDRSAGFVNAVLRGHVKSLQERSPQPQGQTGQSATARKATHTREE